MTRSAAALVGAAVVVATSVLGCAETTTFDMLVTSDRDQFSACTPALVATVCQDADDAAKARCLQSRSAAYGRLRSPKMRRSWLLANGCPPSTVDAPPQAATAVAVTTPPATSAPQPPTPAPPPVAVAPPTPTPAAAPPPPVAAGAPPAARAEPEPAPAIPAPAIPVITVTPVLEPASIARGSRSAAPPVSAFSDKDRPETREQRLREIIVAHRTEMKSCVDRQLKLLPTLRAAGTLIIEVDASGAVPRAQLRGDELAGTPLETCLQTVAARLRFPSNGRAYRIDAPVRVWGSELGR